MAITPVSKSNAKAIKVQNMVKDINDESEITEALVLDRPYRLLLMGQNYSRLSKIP